MGDNMFRAAIIATVLIVTGVAPAIALADCASLRSVARIVMKERQQTNDIDKTIQYVKLGLACRDGDAACNAVEELVESAFSVRRYITTKDREHAEDVFSQQYYDGCNAAR